MLLALLAPTALGGSDSGWLDRSFGRGGLVRTTFVGNERPAAVAVQPNGRILVAGTAFATPTEWDFAVARYLANGSLDRSFGTGGKVRVDLGGHTPDDVAALVVQPDGKIVVAGWSGSPAHVFDSDIALVRLEPDGALDPSFGAGGRVVTDVGQAATVAALALQPDGKLVLSGSRLAPAHASTFLVARYLQDGTLDRSFGGTGWVTTNLPTTTEFAHAVLVQRDGAIVAGGQAGSTAEVNVSLFDFAFVRYRADGSLDSGFGGGGHVLVDLGPTDSVGDLALQRDGKLLAAGTAGNWLVSRPSRFGLVRLRVDGALDPTFGRGGKVVTSFARRSRAAATALVREPGGRLVVGGMHVTAGSSRRDAFALARYLPNGALDRSFGTGGLVETDAGSQEEIVDLARQPNGNVVGVGANARGEAWGWVALRYFASARCVVPDVRRRSLTRAKRALASARCRPGRVTYRQSAARAGIVVAQRPRAGTELAAGGRVRLVVGR